MKQFIITCAFSAIAFGANARSVSSGKVILSTVHRNTPAKTNIDLSGDNLVFRGLASGKTTMYIMDQQGNVERSGDVSRKQNTINISALPKGSHIVALQRGAGVKMFAYTSDVIVKAARP